MGEQRAIHHIELFGSRRIKSIRNEHINIAPRSGHIAPCDPHRFRVEVAGMNRDAHMASSCQRSQLNRRITSSTSQLKHAQLSRWGFTRKRLDVTEQTRHATADGIDPSQPLKSLIMSDRIKTRLIHHLRLPITSHGGQAQEHPWMRIGSPP